MTMSENHYVEQRPTGKRLYDTKAVNRKIPSWIVGVAILPTGSLGSPWIGPNQVVHQATGHTVGIQRDPQKPIVFVHVDDLKLCPAPVDLTGHVLSPFFRQKHGFYVVTNLG